VGRLLKQVHAAVRGSTLGQILGDERGVADDGGEEVVEVVGDAAGEDAEALQLLRLLELEL